MKYLKKNTVKFAIFLARACQSSTTEMPLDGELGDDGPAPDVDANGTSSDQQTDLHAYEEFLDGLSAGEYAELTALMWLGQDINRLPQDWDALVARVDREQTADLRQVTKFKLPQYLRLGMERLARYHRAQKPGSHSSAQSSTLGDASFGPALTAEEMERRIELIGRFTLDAFNQKYGSALGLRKLAEIMDLKGRLTSPDVRRLFGLPPKSERETLESVLRTAEFPPPLP